MGNMIVTWWEAVGEFPGKKGNQLLKRMEFEYAVYPHKGNWEEGEVYAEARRHNAPAILYQVTGGAKGTLPLEQAFLEVENRNLQVSAFKKSEDRNSLILRVYNPSGADLRSRISLTVPGVKITRMLECNLNEEQTGERLTVTGNCFHVNVKPSGIATYEIITDENQGK